MLASLSPTDLDYIRPFLHSVSLKDGSVLEDPSKRVEQVDFIEKGAVSLMALAAGNIHETAMVGCHGFVGVSVVLGMPMPVYRSAVRVSGNSLRISANDLHRLMREHPPIQQHLMRYVQALMIHGSQTALCAARHSIEHRVACWICLACDALKRTVVPVTHNCLSMLLGFRRAGITATLTHLENERVVRKSRGVIQVIEREALQRKACCCYKVIATAYDGLDVGRLRTSTTPSRDIDFIRSQRLADHPG